MDTKSNKPKLPRYFLVDFEIGVKVYEDQGDIVAVNNIGSPYSPLKALYEGQEITREEYDKLFHATIFFPQI